MVVKKYPKERGSVKEVEILPVLGTQKTQFGPFILADNDYIVPRTTSDFVFL